MENTAAAQTTSRTLGEDSVFGTPFFCPTKNLYRVEEGEHFSGEVCPVCQSEQEICNFSKQSPGRFYTGDIGKTHPHCPPRVNI